ncbi:RNA binding motif protein 11 [Clarias gariepinus]|uniref:RNA binding motif protein 11 n=1 Tax=Clarias gariepinus TaxID=13013 RepID=UPI00234C884A|nr:RNA binding motif protein 11 [Clarias gariepinus]
MQEREGEVVQRTVFVFNLSSSVREEILYELFLQAGPVQKVVIPKDRDGNQKSYGFVHYKHAEAVPYAMALLDGIWLYGCPITLRPHYAQTLTAQDDYSWRDAVSGLALGPFFPIVSPTEGPYFPPIMTWAWPNRCVSWLSCSEGLTRASDCSNADETGAERNTDTENHHKGRRSRERRNKQKKKYRS